MGELVDPLENAWLVTQPSTTAKNSYSYINTNQKKGKTVG